MQSCENEVDPKIQSPVASPLAATAPSHSFLWDFVVSRVTVEEMLHRATAFHCIEVCCLKVVSGAQTAHRTPPAVSTVETSLGQALDVRHEASRLPPEHCGIQRTTRWRRGVQITPLHHRADSMRCLRCCLSPLMQLLLL